MPRILITGATGLVGSHVAERAIEKGLQVRALVRAGSDTELLRRWNVELVPGDVTDAASLKTALDGSSWVVHCAAKVGDWGELADFRRVNVEALGDFLTLARQVNVERFVHISSLGVYEARHHHGTDETVPPNGRGLDAYTRTKAEAEELVMRHVREHRLPAVILRPGFIYGPRDRTVLPRVLDRLRKEMMVFIGSGERLMNNTYVGNLVDAVFLALEKPQAVGQIYNVTDGELVSKREFVATIAELAGYRVPQRSIPLGVARALAAVMETTARLLRKKDAPLLSRARVKFLGLNLDFSIKKIRNDLGYEPRWGFREGMERSIAWFREVGLIPQPAPATHSA